MKSVILACLVVMLFQGVASAAVIKHTLVGGVIVNKITSTTTIPVAINYNVLFNSQPLCESAKTAIEQSFFSPASAVTQGLPSENDARKLVHLNCVAMSVPLL